MKLKCVWTCLKVAWILAQLNTSGSEGPGQGRGELAFGCSPAGIPQALMQQAAYLCSACKHISSSGQGGPGSQTHDGRCTRQGHPAQDTWGDSCQGFLCPGVSQGAAGWLCWEVGAGMWSGGLSLSRVPCRGAVVVALLSPLCCSGGTHEWLWPMAREGRGWGMKWCEHNFRNCLWFMWIWDSESGTGLLASLVQSWCVWCNMKVNFAASLTDLSYQTGFEKHSIFKLKAELKRLQPLCLWEGGSPWMGGCKKYCRAELLSISQDHLWQDTEIREWSCCWCWDISWKYAVCPVHRARPWPDSAITRTPPSPGSPHPWVLVPFSTALPLLPFSIAHLCPHVQGPMGSPFLRTFRLCSKEKSQQQCQVEPQGREGKGSRQVKWEFEAVFSFPWASSALQPWKSALFQNSNSSPLGERETFQFC